MFEKIFPFRTQLTIFQLEEYDVLRFLKWIFANYFKRDLEKKKTLKWTSKAKIILSVAVFLIVIKFVFLFYLFSFFGLIIGLLLATQVYWFLILVSLIFLPFEKWKRGQIKKQMTEKIRSLPNLKIIGIVGSYGKTSVKEFLFQMLRTKYAVLRTPENYNTTMSIAKVIDLELDENYDFFICEKGAYHVGDIARFFTLVKPDFGILTGINEQHLERFGGLKNTIQAKFEIVESVGKNGFCLVNVTDENVRNNYLTYETDGTILTYGLGGDKFSIKNVQVEENGTKFDLIMDEKSYQCQTKLFGNANLINILGAASMAFKLGVEATKIVEVIFGLESFFHRMEVKKIHNAIFIDDAYSSNPAGFREALNLLKSFPGKKILATPGIIELGEKTKEIHRKLGEAADQICDNVILIGENERTRNLEKGLIKIRPIYIKRVGEMWKTVEELGYLDPVVLLENDLPENY
jgi:UDP-N-acetylmuramoyl-tripeptide--D-alanyl-D-alanine ligase